MRAIIILIVAIIVVAIVGAGFLLGGFIWMICLGALAHIFTAPALAIGYWSSVIVAVIVWFLLGGLFVGSRD